MEKYLRSYIAPNQRCKWSAFSDICYSRLPNKRTGSNKPTGCKICKKLINEQDVISAQGWVFHKETYTKKLQLSGNCYKKAKKISVIYNFTAHRLNFFKKIIKQDFINAEDANFFENK